MHSMDKKTPTDHRPTQTTGMGRGNEMRRGREVMHEDIARRAYEIFMARGGEHGHHEEDWHQAIRDLQSRQ